MTSKPAHCIYKFQLSRIVSERDGQPICLSNRHRKDLKRVLLRAVNKNQLLILSNVDGTNITSLLRRLSEKFSVPLSTLKLNAKILRDMNLIKWNDATRLTALGEFVSEIMRGESDDW